MRTMSQMAPRIVVMMPMTRPAVALPEPARCGLVARIFFALLPKAMAMGPRMMLKQKMLMMPKMRARLASLQVALACWYGGAGGPMGGTFGGVG